MERNDKYGATGPAGQGNSNELSASAPGAGAGSSQRSESFDFAGDQHEQGLKEKAKEKAKGALDTANEKVADVGSGIRDKAGTARNKLVGALEAGAERLRDRGNSPGGAAYAGAGAEGSVAVTSDGKMSQVSDKLATGMQASADWLRDADLDGLKSGIERQVKEHPGRTLLIAAGLGYLIGRAFRGDK